MTTLISFDLVMEDDMPFVEGCYRIGDGEWSVFTIVKSKAGTRKVGIKKDVSWASGVKGINIVVEDSIKLNRSCSTNILREALGEPNLEECRGPDSMALR